MKKKNKQIKTIKEILKNLDGATITINFKEKKK